MRRIVICFSKDKDIAEMIALSLDACAQVHVAHALDAEALKLVAKFGETAAAVIVDDFEAATPPVEFIANAKRVTEATFFGMSNSGEAREVMRGEGLCHDAYDPMEVAAAVETYLLLLASQPRGK